MWGSVNLKLCGQFDPGFFGNACHVRTPAVRDRLKVRPLVNRISRDGLPTLESEGFCDGFSAAELFYEGFKHWRMISNILNIVKGPI